MLRHGYTLHARPVNLMRVDPVYWHAAQFRAVAARASARYRYERSGIASPIFLKTSYIASPALFSSSFSSIAERLAGKTCGRRTSLALIRTAPPDPQGREVGSLIAHNRHAKGECVE